MDTFKKDTLPQTAQGVNGRRKLYHQRNLRKGTYLLNYICLML